MNTNKVNTASNAIDINSPAYRAMEAKGFNYIAGSWRKVREQATYTGWKKACIKISSKIGGTNFTGDKDMSECQVINEDDVTIIGEWDGYRGITWDL